jgi:hypothetical protein
MYVLFTAVQSRNLVVNPNIHKQYLYVLVSKTTVHWAFLVNPATSWIKRTLTYATESSNLSQTTECHKALISIVKDRYLFLLFILHFCFTLVPDIRFRDVKETPVSQPSKIIIQLGRRKEESQTNEEMWGQNRDELGKSIARSKWKSRRWTRASWISSLRLCNEPHFPKKAYTASILFACLIGHGNRTYISLVYP